MDLQQYYHIHPEILEDKAFLEKRFIDKVFFQEFGKVGLDFLQYQKEIYDSNNRQKYKIDFVIEIDGKKIAIETDGYNFHIPRNKEEFEYQEERSNEITRQGYELIRYSHDKINYHSDQVRKELRYRLPPFPIPNPSTVITPPTSTNIIGRGMSDPKIVNSPKPSSGTTIYSRPFSQQESYQISSNKSSNGFSKAVLWIIVFLIALFLINSRKQNFSLTNSHMFTNPTGNIITTAKSTPTPKIRPSITPIPTQLSSFMNHKLSINIGQSVTLSYDLNRFSGRLNFYTSPTGIIKVQKKTNNHTLTVTGVASGVADILMKDSMGIVIDTCKVTVKQSTPTSKPIREWSFEKDKLSIKSGESIKLNFNRPADAYFYIRSSNNNLRIDYVPNTDYILITGLLSGTCNVSLISDIGSVADTCTVTITNK